MSHWHRCPCLHPTPETQPEHGLGDVGVHEGHSALQLQHLHHHAVTLCWHPLIHAQAQGRVLALEGKMGTGRDMADVLQHHRVLSHHPLTGQGKAHYGAHARHLDLTLPEGPG